MSHSAAPQPQLADYVSLDDIQKSLAAHFPTITSFRWFVRRHRLLLGGSRALILVAGRMKFHPALTEKVVLEAGSKSACRLITGAA